MNKINHYLASANTLDGFKNFFEYINNEENSFTYILKGGPGTGKSSLLKKFGKYYEEKGFSVEYFYCSSDSSSLDGVKILEKNISVVDGTSPHTVEPTIIGVKEKIINLGEFINENIKKSKFQIEKLLCKKKNLYKSAYIILKSAKELFNNEIFEFNNKYQLNNSKIQELILNLKLENQFKKSKIRKLFCSYISSNGISYIYNKNNYKNKIILNGNYLENIQLLNNFCEILKTFGYNFIEFKSLFDSNYNEAVYVEELDTIVFSKNFENKKREFQNQQIINKLIAYAGIKIEKAIFYHKKVEKYYVKNMNFKEMNEYVDKILLNSKNNI